jgi:histidyl-tRNA synthetase
MVGARANALRKPVRWFSVPQLFRYERQQRGRLREHFQLNVDVVGEADVTADAELLAVAVDMMRAFGLTRDDVVARVSDRRLLAALLRRAGLEESQLGAAYAAIDKAERDPRDVLVARLGEAGVPPDAAARALDLARRTTVDELRAEHGGDPAVDEALGRLARYFEYLDALGAGGWAALDLTIVRGLAYYTGVVFELFDARGEFRAICGGGRYDNLLGALGGAELPALGFGMGDVVLGELLRDRGLMPSAAPALDYWVAADDAALLPMVMRVSTLLRRVGHSVEYALRDQALGKQLKAAQAAGARTVAVFRQAAVAERGEVTLRRDGAEQTVSVAAWLDELTAAARDGGPGAPPAGTPAENGASPE